MPRVRLATQFRYRRAKERRAKGDYMAAICDFDEVLRVVHHRMHNRTAEQFTAFGCHTVRKAT